MASHLEGHGGRPHDVEEGADSAHGDELGDVLAAAAQEQQDDAQLGRHGEPELEGDLEPCDDAREEEDGADL